MMLLITFNFFRQIGSWAHQAHATDEYQKKFRKLINTETSDESAETRNTRVIGKFHHRTTLAQILNLGQEFWIRTVTMGIIDHGTEFEIVEKLTILTHTHHLGSIRQAAEKNRTFGIKFYGKSD